MNDKTTIAHKDIKEMPQTWEGIMQAMETNGQNIDDRLTKIESRGPDI